jgi:hypothetical protein
MVCAVNNLSRIEAAKRRLESQKAVLVEAKEAGPPCLRCKHRALSGICTHLAFREQGFDYELGKAVETPSKMPAKDARAGLCGPEGMFFEPIPLVLHAKEIGAVIALAGLGALILL